MSSNEKKRGRRAFRYILDNRWSVLTLAIGIFMVVIICRNLAHAIEIGFEINKLRGERDEYQASITSDSTTIEQLKYDAELERYARERYLMHRSNEEIFIFEGE